MMGRLLQSDAGNIGPSGKGGMWRVGLLKVPCGMQAVGEGDGRVGT